VIFDRDDMGIDRQRDCGRGISKRGLYAGYRFAVVKHQAGERVPQVVETNLPQPSPAERRVERAMKKILWTLRVTGAVRTKSCLPFGQRSFQRFSSATSVGGMSTARRPARVFGSTKAPNVKARRTYNLALAQSISPHWSPSSSPCRRPQKNGRHYDGPYLCIAGVEQAVYLGGIEDV
jgi:hypothetical protein